jgi:hypothetical protein
VPEPFGAAEVSEPDTEQESVEVSFSPSLAEESPAEIAQPADVPESVADVPGQAEEPQSAAGVRLGSEGLSRLRARHAEVLARISERISDPARRDELKSEAERLNPDTWVTDAEVTAGLEQYETVFESLRGVLGRPRRRRRRGRGSERPATPTAEGGAESVPEDADEGGPEEPGPAEDL